MAEEYSKNLITTLIILGLLVLSYILLKPLLTAIILGILLAFIFNPLYNFTNKYLKRKNLTAFIMCIILLALIVIPLWYLAPMMINQSIKFYMASQQIDFIKPLSNIFPNLFQSEQFSNEVASALRTFVTQSTNSLMNGFSKILLNLPTIALQLTVIFFTFFFVLRDKDALVIYIKSLIPFSKDVEKRLFKSTREITLSILYGQVVLGIIQGLIAAIGFFIFRAPNALLLAILSAFAGIIPVVGNVIIWLPVAIYFLIAGNTFAAFGIVIFGLISIMIETLLKPVFVSKFTQLNSSIVLIGIIGGLIVFGVLGVIIGPLILAYLLIVLEIYRDKKLPGVFLEEPPKEAEKKS